MFLMFLSLFHKAKPKVIAYKVLFTYEFHLLNIPTFVKDAMANKENCVMG